MIITDWADNVIPIAGYCACGAPAHRLTLVPKTGPSVVSYACDACRDKTRATLKRVKPVATALRQIGVSEDILTDVMLHLLDLIDEETA